ncbi:MAG TPA: 2OG-Fe(II) oxygenase [Rhizomicrobium sp.]|nr:2OG-Fe(II) oxygenase [Rhizomicrobium sp.]
MDETLHELERQARAGDAAAQLALGRRHAARGETAQARNWLAHAAKAGSLEAARALGIDLLTREPIRGDVGVKVVGDAAQRGDAEAVYVCAMLAAQDEKLPERFAVARDYLREAAKLGLARAEAELQLLESVGDLSSALPTQEIAPRVGVVARCAPPEICDWLIAQTAPRLGRAQVYDPASGGGRRESARSNSAAELNIAQTNLVLMLLRQRIAATAGLAFGALEIPQILHYAVGEEFKPHVDVLDGAQPGYARDLAERGQRVATFLIYLSDDYDGGETEFPRLGLKHKARKGDGLLFWNVDAQGRPDPAMLHAGRAPTRGEKWVLSQWLRDRIR